MEDLSNISEDVIIFKYICKELFASQSTYSYDAIVYKVLETKYGDFARSDNVTLHEIGYIFDCTRERIRQIELTAKKKLNHPRAKATAALNRDLMLSGDDRASIKRYNQRKIHANNSSSKTTRVSK